MPHSSIQQAIRDKYVEFGPESYYQQHGGDYRNPHEVAIRSTIRACHREWNLDLDHVLDLACGSGEATLELRALGAERIDGIDPYTAEAYFKRTGQEARPLKFEQIVAGALGDRYYSLIICSYALHLLETSRLPALLNELAQRGSALAILSPHKRPVVKDDWGWKLAGEIYHQRVRARLLVKSVGRSSTAR